MTPALQAALAARNVTIFGAVEMVLPSRTIRVLDGSGALTIGGNSFTGRDAVFGVLGSIDPLTDGLDDEAPALRLEMIPPTSTAAATLTSAANQGAQVRMWFGALNANGTPVPDPELLFLGEIDTATLSWDATTRRVEFEIVSIFERFFDTEQGNRLSNAFHQKVWPGELGLEFVTGVTERIYWGVRPPAGGIRNGGGGGSPTSPGDRVDFV